MGKLSFDQSAHWHLGTRICAYPARIRADLTGGVGLTTLEPEYEIEVGGLIPATPEEEDTSPLPLSANHDPALKELWDNPDDAEYRPRFAGVTSYSFSSSSNPRPARSLLKSKDVPA